MLFFFFNDTATTEIYTLSLHDALPICVPRVGEAARRQREPGRDVGGRHDGRQEDARRRQLLLRRRRRQRAAGQRGEARLLRLPDRKSTRLNSSHANISYAVFCLKKKTL